MAGHSRARGCFCCYVVLFLMLLGSLLSLSSAFSTRTTSVHQCTHRALQRTSPSCTATSNYAHSWSTPTQYFPGYPKVKLLKNTRHDERQRHEQRAVLQAELMSAADSGESDIKPLPAARAGHPGRAPDASPRRSRLEGLESSVQKWCDYGTSAFPLWVLGAAALGLKRPATMAWFGGGLITAALATTMVSN